MTRFVSGTLGNGRSQRMKVVPTMTATAAHRLKVSNQTAAESNTTKAERP